MCLELKKLIGFFIAFTLFLLILNYFGGSYKFVYSLRFLFIYLKCYHIIECKINTCLNISHLIFVISDILYL